MCGEQGRASRLDLHGRPTWGKGEGERVVKFLSRSSQGNRRKAGVLGATKAEGTGSLKGVGWGGARRNAAKLPLLRLLKQKTTDWAAQSVDIYLKSGRLSPGYQQGQVLQRPSSC